MVEVLLWDSGLITLVSKTLGNSDRPQMNLGGNSNLLSHNCLSQSLPCDLPHQVQLKSKHRPPQGVFAVLVCLLPGYQGGKGPLNSESAHAG